MAGEKWSYEILVVYAPGGLNSLADPSKVWTVKDKKTGLSNWDTVQKWGAEGWEMINGFHTPPYITFLFKKPLP